MINETSKLRVSEIFGPAGYWNFNVTSTGHANEFVERYGVTQGEGLHIGVPSVFIRTFGCNFRCPSFGLDHGEKTTEPQEFAKNIHLYRNISETPAAKYGCDSYFSIYPEFKPLSPKLDTPLIAGMAIQAAGGSFWKNPNDPVHLILTGGEPLMPGWQRAYIKLLSDIVQNDPGFKRTCELRVTIETNGTYELNTEFEDFLANNFEKYSITFSVSPKLSISGHSKEEAIKPKVVKGYWYNTARVEALYLKFVVQSINDFNEVDVAVADYTRTMGFQPVVYIMPEGGTAEEYQKHATVALAAEAVKRGYRVSPRLQVLIGNNLTGW